MKTKHGLFGMSVLALVLLMACKTGSDDLNDEKTVGNIPASEAKKLFTYEAVPGGGVKITGLPAGAGAAIRAYLGAQSARTALSQTNNEFTLGTIGGEPVVEIDAGVDMAALMEEANVAFLKLSPDLQTFAVATFGDGSQEYLLQWMSNAISNEGYTVDDIIGEIRALEERMGAEFVQVLAPEDADPSAFEKGGRAMTENGTKYEAYTTAVNTAYVGGPIFMNKPKPYGGIGNDEPALFKIGTVSDGVVTINLPELTDEELEYAADDSNIDWTLLSNICGGAPEAVGSITISPATAKVFQPVFTVYEGTTYRERETLTLEESVTTDVALTYGQGLLFGSEVVLNKWEGTEDARDKIMDSVDYWYANEACTVSGTETAFGNTQVYDLTLVKGWNRVYRHAENYYPDGTGASETLLENYSMNYSSMPTDCWLVVR
jgi:hypothetical protein